MYEKFRVKNKATNETFRCIQEDETTFFVFLPRAKRKGFRYDANTFHQRFEIMKPSKTPTEQWHFRIRKVIKAINKSGLWTDEIPFLTSLLYLSIEDLTLMREEYWIEFHKKGEPYVSRFADKYPFAYQTTDNGPLLKWNYVSEFANVQTKSMWFDTSNRMVKDDIKRHLEDKKSYRIQIPSYYDVSFEYDASKSKAWYSEEYKGCGNGHYYMAVNENTAVFLEND